MTPKQEERIRTKIARIRKELAADKQRWGGFHDDSRGLRYLPPELFVKLRDYKGGLRYLRWFNRAFPDDAGFPIFLFEWTIILFKTGNLKEAENKALHTVFSNSYLFDAFLGKEVRHEGKEEIAGWETSEMTKLLEYSKTDPEFSDFAQWLETFMNSDKYRSFVNELTEINKKLVNEPVGKTRSDLVDRLYKLI